MQCPTCGTINPAQARFCMGCGVLLVNGLVCGNCQTLLPPQARYCYTCGAYQAQSAGLASGQVAFQVIGQPLPLAAPQPVTLAQPLSPTSALPLSPAVLTPETGVPQSTAFDVSIHQVGQLPTAKPLNELLPVLRRYLTDERYEPLEAVPGPAELQAAVDHMSDLLNTAKTYLPWPVVSAPQPLGEPAGGMQRGVFLFGDVSGFTPLSEKLKVLGQEGAEIITKLINDLFTDLVTVLFDHGGTLLKFGGDAMLGLFPAQTDEDMAQGALRAAQAAFAIQEVLKKERYAAIQVLGETRSLLIKCGISAGPYFAAHIGTLPSDFNPKGTMAYVTTGTTVNEAEEAEGHASPCEVAMLRYVHELLGERAEVGPVNKNPDENYLRLVAVPPLEAGASERLEIHEPPDGPSEAQLTYLAERLSRLTPYLSGELVARLVTSPGVVRIAPENRQVTVMFVNYRGLSKLIEKLGASDPDLITRHLNNYFVHMVSIVERYEGTLARMDQYAVGDRLVVFFGAPRAHEDDPQRAVTTALEMQEAARKNFAALRTATGVHRFEQRVGINTGFLFAGNVGATDLRQEYTLMGDDINMAARLMSNCTWGDIYISRQTRQYVEAYFNLEDMGELQVKGKTIRIPTYKVTGKRTEIGRTRGLDEGESPLIGRDKPLEVLQKACTDLLKAHRGQIVAIIGNSGLGKSRCQRELRAWLATQEQANQLNWIEARAYSFSEQMSYWTASELMRQLLGPKPNATADDVLFLLSTRCETYFGDEAMKATPYLAHMLGLELGEEWAWVKSMDPKVRQKQTFRVAAQFFESAAKERPLLIAIDDMHWTDEASLALIEHLLSVTDKVPLIFLLAFRPRRDKLCWQVRDRAEADYPHRYTEIALEPLERAQSAALLEKLLPGAQFYPQVLKEILDKANGNPLYLEEVVRALRESKVVVPDPADLEQWRVVGDISEIKVPGTLQAAITSRIDRLTEDSRLALQMASVIGRQFRLSLFHNLMQAQEEIITWLSQLERGGLIRPEESLDDLLYNFPDALVQEVAYDSLLMQTRQDVHRQIGETLEALLVKEAEETQQPLEQVLERNCELLAHHFSNSDDDEKALKYLDMAAKRARAQYANQTAIEDYQQIARLKGTRGDKAGQADALYAAGVIAYEIGSYETARTALHDSTRLRQETGDSENEGWSVMYEGMIELKQANYAAALQRHEYAMQLAQTRHDPRQESIHLTNLARVNMRLGQYELALDQFHRSFQMKNEMKDYTGVGFARFYEGLIYIYQGKYNEAGQVMQSALEAWQQVPKNERLMAYYYSGAGNLALGRAQPAEAAEHLQQALDLCAKLDLRAETIENLSLLSQAHLALGDLEAAHKLSTQSIKLLEMQKDVEEAQAILFNHYRILTAMNNPQATDSLQRAYAVMLQCATQIENEAERKIYLEQVKVNQDIQAERNKVM